jgi:hypothetical protein
MGVGDQGQPPHESLVFRDAPKAGGLNLLETPETTGVAGMGLEALHQFREEFEGLVLVLVDDNAFDVLLIFVFKDDLFVSHGALAPLQQVFCR